MKRRRLVGMHHERKSARQRRLDIFSRYASRNNSRVYCVAFFNYGANRRLLGQKMNDRFSFCCKTSVIEIYL